MAKTVKTCEIMQYMEYMDCDIETIERRIEAISYIKTYCLILHDRDVRENGELKAPHFHAVLTFSQAKTFDSIAKAVGIEPQFVNKIKTTTRSAQMYLIHRNDKTKFQYNPEEVRANFDYVELVDDTPVKESISEIVEKINAGVIRPYNIYDYVSIETYVKYKCAFDRAFEYAMKKKQSVDRHIRCFYFFGNSGTGKTTYAKEFAAQNGWSVFISSGGKSPLDDYAGQDCIVLDDIRGSTFPFNDFIKITENNTDSMAGARYYNKPLVYCKAIICTTIQSLPELYSGVTEANKEPKKQLYRRFEAVNEFIEDEIRCYAYDGTDSLAYRCTLVNPIASMFHKEPKTTQDFIEMFGLDVVHDIENGYRDGFAPPADDIDLPFN